MATQTKKEIGIIGLGNMGGNIAKKLYDNGYSLVVYDKTEEKCAPFRGMKNVYLAKDTRDLVEKLATKGNRIVWTMLPAGKITNGVLSEISALMHEGDIVIDASNSIYDDSIANYKMLKKKGIFYLDVGYGGGPEDILHGVSLMIGGDRIAFERAEDIFRKLSGKGTYGYVGGRGAGQKTKLVHNSIFYAIFPAYAEGIELLLKMKQVDPEGELDVKEALRLLASAPPINEGIMKAIVQALGNNELPKDAPEVKVSEMVKWGSEKAASLGVQLTITNSILNGYGSMSEESRRIYTAAKRIITGH